MKFNIAQRIVEEIEATGQRARVRGNDTVDPEKKGEDQVRVEVGRWENVVVFQTPAEYQAWKREQEAAGNR